jgi:protein-disulfide isomerase
MSRSLRLWSILLAGCLVVSVAPAARADGAMSTPLVAGTPTFDDAVHDYLKRHPEAVAEAMQAYQAKQEEARDAQTQTAIGTQGNQLYHNPDSPVAGNPNGKETLVEFFDYSCHFCKQIHPDLQTLLKSDADLKIIYKDFPILGPGSTLAAKAALAAKMQGKYQPMHDALLDFKGQFDDAAIQQIAESAGIDYARLKTDMESADVSKQISDNMALADKLNIRGTPSMIINHQFVGGAIPLDELKTKLQQGKDG